MSYFRCALAFGLCVTPAFVLAADPLPRPPAPRLYLEGQIGSVGFGDLDSKTTSGSTTINGTAVSYSAYRTTFSFDPALAVGAEFGLRNVLGTRLRFGLSWTAFDQKIRDVNATGSMTIGTQSYVLGGATTPTKSVFEAAGVEYARRVNIYQANAYYDFRAVAPYRPFLGLGIGYADLQNIGRNHLALSGSAGTQINITRNLYAGLKVTGYWVKGSKDGLVEYKPMTFGTAMFTTGVHF